MNQPKKERFKTSVGGQALMEGIMMRGPKQMCCAVRKPDGTIETKLDPTPAHGVWMKIPLVRGAIAMIESMIVGYRYMLRRCWAVCWRLCCSLCCPPSLWAG